MNSLHQAEDRHTENLRHVGEVLGNPEPRYTLKKTIEAVKAAVRIEDVAAHYADAKLLGNGRLLARCVAPDHEDRTPIMTVYAESQRFRCYGCGLFGDVVDLEQAAGRHLEVWTAVIALSERYGVELPKRPDRWHRRQDEKARVREAATKHVAGVYQRRLTRVYAPLVLLGGETPEEELRELEELAGSLWPASLDMARRRVAGEE
ncbi:MAG: CHC2 zinc finger domain-containing protein [Actinomycetota bacterium]|nr:CHC2 zinc finger domain-containing protein [Actinomycetota bacterium]